MNWLSNLHQAQPIAHAIGVLTFVCVIGMALGSLKFRGIGLQLGPGFFAVLRQQGLRMNLLATHTKRLDPASGWWRSVLASTGQPAELT